MSPCLTFLLLILLSNMILWSEETQFNLNSTEFDEEESDTVAYMIIVEHAEGRRCAGALVSLRTALSSARCARTNTPATSLWALAAALVVGHGTVRAADGARRVVRVAVAGTDPADPANDLALLAIDEPFGEEAQARPILMATAMGQCDLAPSCNAVRSMTWRNALRLRVVSLQRAPHALCTAHVAHWAALKERSLCLKGETLCESDMGGAVVCAGLLCGVLSVVGGEHSGCADTFGALSVARRRRFLHCAHTQRVCGRGNCATLCTEHWLDGSDAPSPVASFSSAFPTLVENVDSALTPPVRSSLHYKSLNVRNSSRPLSVGNALSSSAVETSARLQWATRTPLVYEIKAEFEPYRADFKAGEYGDNALDYGAPPDEALHSSSSLMSSSRRPATVRRTSLDSVSSDRQWIDPLAQPQADSHNNKLKTSKARSIHTINIGVFTTIHIHLFTITR